MSNEEMMVIIRSVIDELCTRQICCAGTLLVRERQRLTKEIAADDYSYPVRELKKLGTGT